MAKEEYLVDDVRVELKRGKVHKGILTREDTVELVEAPDRQKLLIRVGDTLGDKFSVGNSHIMGLFNCVPLR